MAPKKPLNHQVLDWLTAAWRGVTTGVREWRRAAMIKRRMPVIFAEVTMLFRIPPFLIPRMLNQVRNAMVGAARIFMPQPAKGRGVRVFTDCAKTKDSAASAPPPKIIKT